MPASRWACPSAPISRDAVRAPYRGALAAAQGALPDESAIDKVYELFVPLNEEVVSDYCTLIPGALETANHIRAKGMKIGSTTGYTRSIMQRVLPLAAAQGYAPDNLVCADDLPLGRPTRSACINASST
jgi:phosphonoacetaldehyde hydrolase